MPVLEKRVTVICGHYGTGKTNLSLNLAIDSAKSGDKVTLIDMDIVNPYFRSADYDKLLSEYGIKVIGPNFANSNLDTPSLPPAIGVAIEEGEKVIIDVGGDDAGATALAVYSRHLSEADPEVLCVVNMYRSLTRTAEDALSVMKEIEQMARIKVTGIVNNSHLKQRTTWEHISESLSFAEDVARMADVPLKFITVPKSVNPLNKIDKIYPVDVYVKAPWE